MGGRGRSSGLGARQVTMEHMMKQSRITDILQASQMSRNLMTESGSAGGGAALPIFKKCVCCREYTIPFGTNYSICSNCGWVDDPYQNRHPDSLKGANMITLSQARKAYGEKNSEKM